MIVLYRLGCQECSSVVATAHGCVCNTCREGNVVGAVSEGFSSVILGEVEDFSRFFRAVTGFEPWSLQLSWAKRLLGGESFALIAPTGVGKSTLLAVYALYKAFRHGSKVYIVTPTVDVAKQFDVMMSRFKSKAEEFWPEVKGLSVVLYDSKRGRDIKKVITSGQFNVLVSSASFLIKNYDTLREVNLDTLIADDLDCLLRNSKSVDTALKLLGFDEDVVSSCIKLVKLKQRLIIAKASRSLENLESMQREVEELSAYIRDRSSRMRRQLVVASATGRIRGLKSLVLRELMGFDAGVMFEYWRNVDDVYLEPEALLGERIIGLVKKLGSGIILYSRTCRDLAERFVDLLNGLGLTIGDVREDPKAVERFRGGSIDYLVGPASYYGKLVRGLDEPLRIKFVLFIGVPSVIRRLEDALTNLRLLYVALRHLQAQGIDVSEDLRGVVDVLRRCTPSALTLYSKVLRGLAEPPGNLVKDVEVLSKAFKRVVSELRRLIEGGGSIALEGVAVVSTLGGEPVIATPDPYTYIQGSGRCSRLLNGVKTYGLSLITDKWDYLVRLLEMKLRRLMPFQGFKTWTDIDLDKATRMVEESRREARGSQGLSALTDSVETALIIVESPTKAKTIASMFGKPAKRVIGNTTLYETVIPLDGKFYVATVMATLGHIVDLVTDDGFHGVRMGKEAFVVYDFITRCRECSTQHVGVYDRCPYCGSVNVYHSSSVYNVMRKVALEVNRVFVATDPDSEGEKIAFDVENLLYPYNSNIYRIEFREVTKSAVLNALRSPRRVDVSKAMAQIVRRVADRWIGFEVSMRLQDLFNKPWLGAGRVQSPVLLWIVDRYGEYRSRLGYLIVVLLGGVKIKLFVHSNDRAAAERVANDLMERGFLVEGVTFTEVEVPPPPPLTTDSLIAEANSLYGFSASKTMALAQALFELGLITYHRTDSTRLSSHGLAIAREALQRVGLLELFTPRSWSAEHNEGAHEAIRPTRPLTAEEVLEAALRGELGIITRLGPEHLKVYDLVYKRFLASQMPAARVINAKLTLSTPDHGRLIEVSVPVEVAAAGFTTLWPLRTYPSLRYVKAGSVLKPEHVTVVRGSEKPLYRVADIVKLMKEHRIGRPSTYSKAIDNNIRHGYVVLSKRRGALVPTRVGIEVAQLLRERFAPLVQVSTTRYLEELMDFVERGEKSADQALEILRDLVEGVVGGSNAVPEAIQTPA